MSYKLEWFSEDRTIILAEMGMPWAWTEFMTLVHETYDLIATVEHRVDVVVLGAGSQVPPGSMISMLRKLRDIKPKNMGTLAFVGAGRLIESVADVFARVYPGNTPLYFARTQEAAIKYLEDRRT